MTKKDPIVYVKFRLPPERHEWLKKRAEANNRSINAEINFLLGYFKMLEENGNVPRMA